MASIYRGTTPILTILCDFDVASCEKLWVTFNQNKLAMTKELPDIEYDGETITVKFSQEETLMFDDTAGVVYVQIRGIDGYGNAFATNISSFDVNKILKEGVIG